MSSLANRLFSRPRFANAVPHRPAPRSRLRLQPLEDRLAPATFTVSNTSDGPVTMAGQLPGSLRQAIFDANALAGADTIDFKAGLAGVITLTTGELGISEDATITGPGAGLLFVSGNNASRVFSLTAVGTGNVSISD